MLLFLGAAIGQAQNDSITTIRYTPDFQFKEGLYLSYEQFRANSPLPKTRIATDIPYNRPNFFEELFADRFLFIYDDLGTRRRMAKNDLWGFSTNNKVYIYHNNVFNHISYLGSISHFLSQRKIYEEYSSQFYSDYTISRRMPVSVTTETTEYILIVESGEIYEYTTRSVAAALMADPELHDTYMKERRRKREQLKFYYIRQFNERNPLYFEQQVPKQ